MARSGKIQKTEKQEQVTRPVRWRKYKQLFLIVCEDAVTEPAYFGTFASQFPPNTMFVKPIGTGRDPEGVVDRAIIEKYALHKESGKEVDFTWIVFDKDDANLFPARLAAWNRAYQKINTNKFLSAMSNEVFELWFLLHFEDVDPAISLPRQTVYDRLGIAVQHHPDYATYVYDHYNDGGEVVPIVNEIGNLDDAIQRAEGLLAHHGGKPLIETNPSTRVHLLVKELLNWIAYYQWTPE